MSNSPHPDMNQADVYQHEHIEEQRIRLSEAVKQLFRRKEVRAKFCALKLHEREVDNPNFVWNALRGHHDSMDICHSDFHNTIGFYGRIQSLSNHLELTFPTFEAEEQFYVSVAELAGLDGWELDRLLFHFGKDVRDTLDRDIARAA